MKKTQLIFASIASLLFSNALFSQEKPKEWDVSLYGFARADYIFDSRQSAQVREYHLNLYPLDKKLDANGDDINATGASNFLSVVSRLGVNFKGPNVWGAKASGKLEGDFFGNTQESIGLFRLRHAYAQLAWEKSSLTLGQTWYPSFVPEVFPGVANFSTGIMFNPFGWVGQIRFRQSLTSNLSLDLVAYKDREFQASVVSGNANNSPTFNSTTPTLHAQLQYKTKNLIAGVGAEYQSLKPVITSGGLASDEKLNSTMLMGYFKYSNENVVAKFYGISGGNLHHLVMLGGYASYAETNGIDSYKPTKTSAFWVDIASNKPNVAPGVFFGYTKNSGLEDANYKSLYVRGVSGTRVVDNVWRASARVDFKQNKFKISPELEYTAATWGDLKTDATSGNNETNVGNFRALVSASYSF